MSKRVTFRPNTLIVIIFGSPLKDKEKFRIADIESFTGKDMGLTSILSRLVEPNWLTVREITVSMQGTRGGRPTRNIYTRTRKGEHGYRQIVNQLAPYNILLR